MPRYCEPCPGKTYRIFLPDTSSSLSRPGIGAHTMPERASQAKGRGGRFAAIPGLRAARGARRLPVDRRRRRARRARGAGRSALRPDEAPLALVDGVQRDEPDHEQQHDDSDADALRTRRLGQHAEKKRADERGELAREREEAEELVFDLVR